MPTIQVRIDAATKKSAQTIVNRLGFDLSSAIKIYLRQITQKKGLPFPVVTKNGFTFFQEDELVKVSNQTLRQFKSGKLKGYKSFKSMLKDLF